MKVIQMKLENYRIKLIDNEIINDILENASNWQQELDWFKEDYEKLKLQGVSKRAYFFCVFQELVKDDDLFYFVDSMTFKFKAMNTPIEFDGLTKKQVLKLWCIKVDHHLIINYLKNAKMISDFEKGIEIFLLMS